MSALAGLFLNAKDKAVLSRFGDLRPVLLLRRYLPNFLQHGNVFRITEDPRMGDCVVDVYTQQIATHAGASNGDDWSTVNRKKSRFNPARAARRNEIIEEPAWQLLPQHGMKDKRDPDAHVD